MPNPNTPTEPSDGVRRPGTFSTQDISVVTIIVHRAPGLGKRSLFLAPGGVVARSD